MCEDRSAVVESFVIERTATGLSKVLPAIYLVGPMGAGKTTIGRLLAKQLGRTFIDCDNYIMEQTGADISWIFEKEGEAGFRERETRALESLTAMSNIVVATGGGAVVRAENRALLSRGLVIFIDAKVDVQILRTKKDKNRPLLHSENPQEVLESLYQTRLPMYTEVADIVVPTGRAYPKQMLSEILGYLMDYAKYHKHQK